jgi:hypothetical protein
MIEVLKDARLGIVLAIERLKLEDGALTLTPAVVPGGPPDYKMAARDIDWQMTSPGWLTTPPDCPASGQWTSTGTFTFDDGATVTETTTTPCPPPPVATSSRKARAVKRCRGKRRASKSAPRKTRGCARAKQRRRTRK